MAGSDDLDLRILIGAGSFTDAAAALRIVQGLPDPLFSGLGGLLVEEPEVFTACRIPHQQVVLPSGLRTMAPTVPQIKLMLRADARAFQRAVSQVAKTANAKWAFAEGTGDLIATSLRATKGWDVLLMGYRRVHRSIGKVVVIKHATTKDDKMDIVSQSLSYEFSTGRAVFSVRPPTEATRAPQSSVSCSFDTFDDCLRAIARTNSLVVLLDLDQGPVSNPADLARVMDAARCPVMVFGAQTQKCADEDADLAIFNQTGAQEG